MDVKSHRALLSAAVAGLVAAVGSLWVGPSAQAQEGETVHCYGINKCKGSGDCGGKGHACAGQNGCQGQAFLDLAEDDCLRIAGGRLTPELAPEPES